MDFFDYTHFMCSLSIPDSHIEKKENFLKEIAPKKLFGHIKKEEIDNERGIYQALVEDPVEPKSSKVKLSFDDYIEELSRKYLESEIYKTFNSSNDQTVKKFIKQAPQKLEQAIEQVEKHKDYFLNFPKYRASLNNIYELLNDRSVNRGGRSQDFDPYDTFKWYNELIQKDEYIKNGKPYLKLIDQKLGKLHQNKQQTDSPPDRSTIRRHRRKFGLTQR